ncbi:MAG: hypothetical protein AUK44_05465 [Porphyromonadaceae bacterium CG2_30_38_12]|nr:MAG: hypothetical protein AUK44_05465 [Porphyromonadaceae bacterium CG2_30_38_12]
MNKYIQLIRYKNLLLLAFVQFVMQQVIIAPLLQKFGFEYNSASNSFFLLLSATLFIASAGYIINDYFDLKIDRINKPDQVIIGNSISKRGAMIFYQILTAIGMVCGLLLAFQLKSFTLAFLFIVVPGLLWFYAASYKRQFLIGNLIVALLALLSVLVVAITAIASLKLNYGNLVYQTAIPTEIYAWVGGFALFSFLTNFIREIIKDMEDIEGDKELECRTMAIVWGVQNTKIFVYSLILIFALLLYVAHAYYIPFDSSMSWRYLIFGIALPLLILLYLIFKAQNRNDFHAAASLLKYIMLIGVLYSFVFYFLMAQVYHLPLFNLFILK